MPLSQLRSWSEHDYSTALALTLYEAGLCSGCGHPVAESQAKAADPNDPDGDYHYEAPVPSRCHACTAVAARAAEYSGDEVKHAQALRFRAERVHEH